MIRNDRQLNFKMHSSFPQRRKLKENIVQRGSIRLERSLSLAFLKTTSSLEYATTDGDVDKRDQDDTGLEELEVKTASVGQEMEGKIMSATEFQEDSNDNEIGTEEKTEKEIFVLEKIASDKANDDVKFSIGEEIARQDREKFSDVEERLDEATTSSSSEAETIPDYLQIPTENQSEETSLTLQRVCRSLLEFDSDDNEIDLFESYDSHATCDICFIAMAFDDLLQCKDCKNFHCKICMNGHIKAKITEGFMRLRCPSHPCSRLLNDNEIEEHCSELVQMYMKNIADAENNPRRKTCPGCNMIHHFQDADIPDKNKCSNCRLLWCVRCHAPWHVGMTCAKYQKDIVGKGKKALKIWAKSKGKTEANARKCPHCHFYIERISGCDHMCCSRCGTDFCYQCGKKHRKAWFLGDHYSRYRFFGCKYNLAADKPALRIAVRSGFLAGTVLALPVAGGLLLSAGCILVAFSPVLLPAVLIKKKCFVK